MAKLAYNTVSPLLKEVLERLVSVPELSDFRLVGGTSLSLRYGHRESVDIDLFTEQQYGSIDWRAIYNMFRTNFTYASTRTLEDGLHSFGESFYVGKSQFEYVKVDLFYTDPFLRPADVIDGIPMASVDDIVAMKVDVIANTGRKKDFWDLHELLSSYTIEQMLNLHQHRSPWTHDRESLIHKFTDFKSADEDFDPKCLKGKYWEFIKTDFVLLMQQFSGK